MKLNKILLSGVFGIFAASAMTSCSEEATLDGANVVFIEMTPSDVSMTVGDTIPVSAVVSNEAGKTINTPVKWSIDDESVAQLFILKTGRVKGRVVKKILEPLETLSRTEGEEGGDTPSTGEGEGGEETPDVPEVPEKPVVTPDTTWTSTYALLGMRGAQGKSTILRATLENGQYAIAPVAVLAREINNCIKAISSYKRSYQTLANDTAWFSITPFQLVDEAELSYDLRVTKVFNYVEQWAGDDEFRVEYPDDPQRNIFIDRENKRVGVVYTAPRFAGMGEVELTVSDGATSSSAVVPVYVYTRISPGFELQNGHRPNYDDPNPSNIKVLLMNSTMDVKSTYNLGVCLGLPEFGHRMDIENAYAMEKQDLLRWEVESGPVLATDMFIDWDYNRDGDETNDFGYVSYVKLQSGATEGLAVIKFIMPDTTLICNLTIEDFNKTYPVERVVVMQDNDTLDANHGAVFALKQPASLEVKVDPEPSFDYHVPEITVADESILTVQPRGEAVGYTRMFDTHRAGETTITITSLDKTVTIPVKVEDVVTLMRWSQSNNTEYMVGSTGELVSEVTMASGQAPTGSVTWHVSDPTVLSVTTKPGTFSTGQITCLKEGTCDVWFEYQGRSIEPVTITVTAANDIEINDATDDEERYFGDNGDGTMYFNMYGASEIEISGVAWNVEGDPVGTFTGSGCSVYLNGETFEGCSYSLTITSIDDYYYSVSGSITLPNGVKLIFNNTQVASEL